MYQYTGTDPEEVFNADQAKAELFRSQADVWIEANPDAWGYMVRAARASAAKGRRFGMKALAEYARYSMLVQGVDEFRINNSYVSAMARRLVEQCPEVGPYMSTRRSVLDG